LHGLDLTDSGDERVGIAAGVELAKTDPHGSSDVLVSRWGAISRCTSPVRSMTLGKARYRVLAELSSSERLRHANGRLA
jgi:hypothetical protein